MTHQLTLGHVTLQVPEMARGREQWRRRAVSVLERVSLDPDLPPHSILVIRHLPDPRPGRLLAGDPWRGVSEWSRDAQAWIEACWRRAVRPAAGPVPASADAVWFADMAEWLACLTWDIHCGLAAARWWWQTWLPQFGAGSRGDMLYQLWQREPRWLPQALAMLVERHRQGIQALLLRPSPRQCHHIRKLVLAGYDLPPETAGSQSAEPLWPLLPDSVRPIVAGLPVEAAALASLCLGIVHAPSAIGRHLHPAPVPAPIPQPEADRQPDPTRLQHAESQPAPVPEMDLIPTDSSAPPAVPASPEVHSVPPSAIPTADPASQQSFFTPTETAQLPGDDRPASPHDSAPLTEDKAAAPPPVQIAPPDAPLAEQRPDSGAATAVEDAPTRLSSLPDSRDAQGFHTRFGGLWYLINVLADLAWVDSGASALDAWRKLAALAQAIQPDISDDPVWEVLAAQLPGAPRSTPEADPAQWLAQALPRVQDYLAARLEDPAAFAHALRDPARLHVTRTHVDVFFSLDQVRLDFRLAGLDRNPGWIPELAHVITLYYE